MRKYKIIKQVGLILPTKTIKGIKILIRKNHAKVGNFTCETPKGITHNWEIQHSQSFTKKNKTISNLKAVKK